MWPHESLLEPVWQRVAIALVHFIWQGVLVAAAYSALARWLRRPEQRYAAGLVALAVMAVCPFVTYAIVQPPITTDASRIDAGPTSSAADEVLALHSQIPAGLLSSVDWAALSNETDAVTPVVIDEAGQSAQSAASWRGEFNRWIVLGWLVGVAVCSLRLLAGAAGLRSVTRRTSPAEKEQLQTLERLARALGFRHPPRLRVSEGLAQAIAAGLFRPLIVVPAAWLSELPPAVIEAVLAHELAHIRRHDLWVNLIQRAVESVLFFHPAVWWLSRQIRSEREMCCDEMAVGATREKVAYVNALEIVARRAAGAPRFSLATGIGGRKMQLLARVRHVLGLPAARRPGSLWGAGVLALAVPLGAWAISGPAAPFAFAQEEGERAQRERDEQRQRQRAERQERRAQRDEQRQRRRAVEERELAERERDDQERRRDERVEDERRVRVELDFDRMMQAEDKQRRAAEEQQHQADSAARYARAVQQKQQQQQEQVRQELNKARDELKRRVGEAQETIAAAMKEAEAAGQKDHVQALRNKLEAVQQQAMAEAKAMEAKLAHAMGDLNMKADEAARAAARKAADAEAMIQKAQHELREQQSHLQEKLEEAHKQGDKAAIEKLHATMEKLKAEHGAMREKLLHALGEKVTDRKEKVVTDKVNKVFIDKADKVDKTTIIKKPANRDDGASPEAQREVMQMIKELRGEVQELRREVQALRGQGGGDKSPKQKPKPKPDKVSILGEIPYVGRLFNKEEVEIEFVDPPSERLQLDTHDVEIELKLQKEELDKLDKVRLDDLKAIELEKIEARNALKDVEFKSYLEKRNLASQMDVEIPGRNAAIEALQNVAAQVRNSAADKVDEAALQQLAKRAANDIEVRYATKAAAVAKKEWEQAVEANKRTPGAITQNEIERLNLAHERGLLEIERAKRGQLDRLSKLKTELQQLNKQSDDAAVKRTRDLLEMIQSEAVGEKAKVKEKPKSEDKTETKAAARVVDEKKEKPTEPEKK